MFGGKDVNDSNQPKYIRPGVFNVTIKNVKGEINANGNPVILLSLYLTSGDPEATTDFRFYMSEKAQDSSYKKIRNIFKAVTTDADYLSSTANDIEELGEVYNTKLSGKSLRMKFNGEEYIKNDGNIGVKALIGFGAAEATNEGAEYPVLSDAQSKLKFDEVKDIKKLAKVPDTDVFGARTEPTF